MKCASWLLATRWPELSDLLGRSWPGRFECGAHTTVCLENGLSDDCGSVFCSFLAFGDGGGFCRISSPPKLLHDVHDHVSH